jgi:hypothetical protein
MSDEKSEATKKDAGNEAQAAQQQKGQDQEPKQAQEDSSGTWDSKEHSDAPGPFGTGDKWDSAKEEE